VLIVLPVTLYIFLAFMADPKSQHSPGTSPEWNIATIFLVAQAQSLYRLHLESTGRRLSHPALGLITSASLIVVVFAATNIQFILHDHSERSVVAMWLLFSVATISFLGFVIGARIVSLRARAKQ
jgi:FlaA1/EpsC-like NDP-sugar epimerase